MSFGNVVSQISLPCFMSHASIPAEVRAARGLPDDLVRISCGIEDAGDLIAGKFPPQMTSMIASPPPPPPPPRPLVSLYLYPVICWTKSDLGAATM